MNNSTAMLVEGFFDPHTWTVSYLVMDRNSMQCALVDSVLDYDPKSGPQTAPPDSLPVCANSTRKCSGYWKPMSMPTIYQLLPT